MLKQRSSLAPIVSQASMGSVAQNLWRQQWQAVGKRVHHNVVRAIMMQTGCAASCSGGMRAPTTVFLKPCKAQALGSTAAWSAFEWQLQRLGQLLNLYFLYYFLGMTHAIAWRLVLMCPKRHLSYHLLAGQNNLAFRFDSCRKFSESTKRTCTMKNEFCVYDVSAARMSRASNSHQAAPQPHQIANCHGYHCHQVFVRQLHLCQTAARSRCKFRQKHCVNVQITSGVMVISQ